MPPQNPSTSSGQSPNQPPMQPAPAPVAPASEPAPTQPMAPKSGSNWGAIIGILVIVALLALGGAYFFYTEREMAQTPAANTEAQNPTSDQSIQNDLNATGSADASADVENLNNSL